MQHNIVTHIYIFKIFSSCHLDFMSKLIMIIRDLVSTIPSISSLFYYSVLIAMQRDESSVFSPVESTVGAHEYNSDKQIVQTRVLTSKAGGRKSVSDEKYQESKYTRTTPLCIRKMSPSPEMAKVLFHTMLSDCSVCYKCKVCGKVIHNHKLLHGHMVVHSDHRPYVCEICPNKKYKLAITLKNHIKQKHTNVRDFTCQICGQGFALKVYLKSHMMYHMQNRPLKCPYCPKTFVVSAALDVHVNSHVGKRPFACDKCPWRFKCRNGLENHQLVHSKDRPWLCDVCSMTFKSKGCLQSHRKTQHTKTKRFACSTCGATYNFCSKLIKHAEKCGGVLGQQTGREIGEEPMVVGGMMVDCIEKDNVVGVGGCGVTGPLEGDSVEQIVDDMMGVSEESLMNIKSDLMVQDSMVCVDMC